MLQDQMLLETVAIVAGDKEQGVEISDVMISYRFGSSEFILYR